VSLLRDAVGTETFAQEWDAGESAASDAIIAALLQTE
jgi:hypothetical protein